MKNKAQMLLLILVLSGISALWWGVKHNYSSRMGQSSSSVTPPASTAPAAKAKTADDLHATAQSAKANAAPARRPASGPADLAALNDMSRTLFQFSRPASDIKALVDYLESTRQEPMVVRDANPYTGELAIVRTRSPLAGTRYFHAQYFGDGNGEGFVQHMSFEFKPGPSAMEDAIRSVQQNFGLGSPKVRRDDYAQWSLKEGYIVWVKKMDMGDLHDDPFNAYTSADAGTIRVAIEAEIH